MKKTLTVTWTISENVAIEIPETATNSEIAQMVEDAVEIIKPLTIDYEDCQIEWEDEEPKGCDLQNQPPDQFWFEVAGRTVATNGFALVTKECDLTDFVNQNRWLPLTDEKPIAFIEDVLARDFSQMAPHKGYFNEAYKCFDRFKVVGSMEVSGITMNSAGYVVDDGGVLLAMIMPSSDTFNPRVKDFQFNTNC